jgi:hypothetical protein
VLGWSHSPEPGECDDKHMDRVRRDAVGGVVGPVAFVAAWSLLGLSAHHYSATQDAISRLAETGAPTRVAMTTGFVVFGVGVPLYARALRSALGGPAWVTAFATGIATLGVAAVPLGAPTRDTVHGWLAAAGYVTLAATPLFASRRFARAGRAGWSRASLLSGMGAAVCLVATTAGPSHGLFQRLGLGCVDIWIVATAIEMLRTGRLVDTDDNSEDGEALTLPSSSLP